MSVEVINQEHYDKVRSEAERLGILPLLDQQLIYLGEYADHDHDGATRCKLGWDFAPLSFSFMMQKRDEEGGYKNWFNGGLIFHPGHGQADQSLSVELVGQDGPHWSVHT